MMCTVAPQGPCSRPDAQKGVGAPTASAALQETDNLLRAVNYPRLHTSPDPMQLANPFAPVGSRFADRATDDDAATAMPAAGLQETDTAGLMAPSRPSTWARPP